MVGGAADAKKKKKRESKCEQSVFKNRGQNSLSKVQTESVTERGDPEIAICSLRRGGGED